jgi:hypothetical protein
METQMYFLRKLGLLTALAMAALAVFAMAASATIKDSTLGGTQSGTTTGEYSGAITSTETGPSPTLVSGASTVTCTSATANGTSTGGGTSQAELSFAWSGCTVVSGGLPTNCTVNPISNVTTVASPTGSGNGILTQAENAGTTITCLGAFVCQATSTTTTGGTAGAGPVTAVLDAAADTADISDQVQVTGSLGCTDPGTWDATYAVAQTDLEVW